MIACLAERWELSKWQTLISFIKQYCTDSILEDECVCVVVCVHVCRRERERMHVCMLAHVYSERRCEAVGVLISFV